MGFGLSLKSIYITFKNKKGEFFNSPFFINIKFIDLNF